MKFFLLIILSIFSSLTFSQSWVLVSSDSDSQIFVDKSSIKRESKNLSVSWKMEFLKLNSVVFNKSLLNCSERESSLQEMIVQEPNGNLKRMNTSNLGWEFVPKNDKPASLAFDYVCSRNVK